MSEQALIDWIRKTAPRFAGGVRVGIGDDCAVYRPAPGEELVFTTDFTIEGRHFERPAYTPREIGYKAMARGLSDLAAMAAEPRFALVSLAAPDEALVKPLMRGVFAHGVEVAGGDLSWSEKIHVDVVACGGVPRGKALLRSGVKPGDVIAVTGPLGRWKKRPRPRLDLVERMRGRAHAAMDITDGLSMDLDRMLRASGLSCEITAAPPVARGATLEQAWHHGEDYELLVASAKPLGEGFFEIARAVEGKPGSPLPPKGWDHFR
jgi:thiamine-monophosphate kinase